MNSRIIRTKVARKGNGLNDNNPNNVRVGPLAGSQNQLVFTGYASVFGVTDRDSEQMEQGSFAQYLESNKNEAIKLLIEHNSFSPIGYITHIEEDNYGLYIEGELSADASRETMAMIANGNMSGLSVGYIVDKENVINNINHITKAELVEISIVSLPSNNLARIISVNTLPTKYFAMIPDYATGKTRAKGQGVSEGWAQDAGQPNVISSNDAMNDKLWQDERFNANSVAGKLRGLLGAMQSDQNKNDGQALGVKYDVLQDKLSAQPARLVNVLGIAIKLAEMVESNMATR